MVDINGLVREAGILRDQADHEADPKIRDRLNRMAETYAHIAKIESENHDGSIDAMMVALTNSGR